MADKLLLEDGTGYLTLEDGTGSYLLESNGRLYLRNTTTNGISIGGVPCYDLSTTPGSSPDTAVTDTTNGGTEIQFTKTAGGSVAAFITGRVPAGGWTITSSDVALWLQESASTVNAGLRFRLFKYSGGTETELGGSPFDKGTEFNTGTTLETLVGNVTDTALAEDDRLLLRIYAVNVGTMGAGTSTLNFNGAVGVGGGGAPGLSGSYTNETTAVNLTTLGSEDFIAISSTGTTIRKTGGGSLITAVPWDFVSDVSASVNNDGADQDRQFTTTDATPSNITNDTGGQYTTSFNAAARNGWKITAPAGTGERVLKVYLGHFYTTGATGQLHLTASISGAGAPSSIDLLPSQNVNADTELTATITYTAGQAGQTITLEYRPDAEASDGLTRYLSFRAAWVGPAGSGVPYADSYINVYPAVTLKAESGGSAQNLTAPLTTNSQTFYPASVSAGAASVTPPLLTNNQSFPAATVNRGAVGVTAPLVSNSNTVFEPVVIKGAVDLLPPVLGSSLAVYSPTVSVGVVEIAPPLVTNTQSFHSPVVSSGQVLFPELLVNSQVFYAPTVIRNDAELQPPLLVNNQSFYTPTVAAGGNDVVAPLVTNTNTVFAPSITIENHIAAPLVVNTNTVFAPATSLAAYQLTAGMVVNSQSFLVPTITTSVDVVAGLVSNNQTFFGASIATGATTIVPQRVSNQQTFFIPTVTGGVPPDADSGFYSVFERRRRREQKRR